MEKQVQEIKRAMAGDKDALVSLIMKQKNDYYRLAYVYMKNQEDALDALEDMILILYQRIGSLKKEEAFYSWSKRILVSCCLDRIRKNKRLVHLEDWEKADPRDAYRDKDHQIDLEREINRLKAKQQEVIRLRFFLDYDYKTISEITNTPLGTVKSRLYHGLRNLRKGLGGEYNG